MPTITTTPDVITVRHEIEPGAPSDGHPAGHVVIWTYMRSPRSSEVLLTGCFTRGDVAQAVERMYLIERAVAAMARLAGDTYEAPASNGDKYDAIWAVFDRMEEQAVA